MDAEQPTHLEKCIDKLSKNKTLPRVGRRDLDRAADASAALMAAHTKQHEVLSGKTTSTRMLQSDTILRNPHHWAIHITSPTRRSTLHQAHDEIGGRGYYVANERCGARPSRARLY